MMDREPIWAPDPHEVQTAKVSRFARWLTENGRAELTGDYLELWRWSVDRLEEFWSAVWDYFGVRSATRYERVLTGSVMPDVEWFTGAQVSYVGHVFKERDPDRVALIDARESAQPGEGPVSRHLTWGMLRQQAGDLAKTLRDLGVGPGDRVAGYVPNTAEAVIAFLATASPDEIITAPAIPHTRTGKKLEIPVKRILQGGDPHQVMDPGAVDNPDALLWFAAYQIRTPIP
jgi:acetoacetyl-CoA synthetase